MENKVLIKVGGRAFESKDTYKELASDIQNIKNCQFIIVHGGGVHVSQALRLANREPKFIDGLRITTAKDIEIVERVLSNQVNTFIASTLQNSGLHCTQLSGKDEGLFIVKPLVKDGHDMGYVGDIVKVNPMPVYRALEKGYIPVVSPISGDIKGTSYNVNADNAAAALAIATRCSDLTFFTDVPGVRIDGKIQPVLTVSDAKKYMANGTITEGMIAKMESAFHALENGVERVHITKWDGVSSLSVSLFQQRCSGTTIILENR